MKNLDRSFKTKYKESFTNIVTDVLGEPLVDQSIAAKKTKKNELQMERDKVGKEFSKELQEIYAENSVERYIATYICIVRSALWVGEINEH